MELNVSFIFKLLRMGRAGRAPLRSYYHLLTVPVLMVHGHPGLFFRPWRAGVVNTTLNFIGTELQNGLST